MRAFSAFALFLLVAGCASAPPVGLAADLPGTTWTLERVVLVGGDVLRGDGDAVTFGVDGSLAFSSCNQCSGRFAVRDALLTIDEPMACTRRACPAGDIELERYLTGTASIQRDGAYLVIEPAEGAASQVLLVPGTPGSGAPAGAP